MTTAHFVHAEYPREHAGVVRVEHAVAAARSLRSGFNGARSLAALLLAAMVSALLVAADQMIDTWAEGHLLAAWVLLWAVGFAALGLFAGTARSLAGSALNSLKTWSAHRAQARSDERMWSVALTDARIMAEIVRAQADAIPMAAVGAAEAEAHNVANHEAAAKAARIRRNRMLANRNDF